MIIKFIKSNAFYHKVFYLVDCCRFLYDTIEISDLKKINETKILKFLHFDHKIYKNVQFNLVEIHFYLIWTYLICNIYELAMYVIECHRVSSCLLCVGQCVFLCVIVCYIDCVCLSLCVSVCKSVCAILYVP